MPRLCEPVSSFLLLEVSDLRFLLLLFVVMPIAEMWLLIEVGGQIGALNTIALVALTAIIGLALLRRQGFSTLWRAQQRLESGELPAQEILEGMLLAVGGALLLTPGFITDSIGFACLVPGLRQLLVARLAKRFVVVQSSRYQAGDNFDDPFSGPHPGPRSGGQGHNTIDGEFKRHD